MSLLAQLSNFYASSSIGDYSSTMWRTLTQASCLCGRFFFSMWEYISSGNSGASSSQYVWQKRSACVRRALIRCHFQSFALISTLVSTILEFVSLILFNRFGLNRIPSGPIALIFSILYQHARLVPSIYHFRVFGVTMSNKVFMYILALQVSSAEWARGTPTVSDIVTWTAGHQPAMVIHCGRGHRPGDRRHVSL